MRLSQLFLGVGRRDFLFSLGSIGFAGGIVLGTVLAGESGSPALVPESQTIQPAPPTGTTLASTTTRARVPRTASEATRGTVTGTSRGLSSTTLQRAPSITGRQPPPSTRTTLPPPPTTQCKVRISISTLHICIRVQP